MPTARSVTPPATPIDLSLRIRETREGSSVALGALYDEFAPSLYRTALRLCGNRDDAEDVVHDCFVGLPLALRQYDERGRFDAWLRQIVVRMVLMRRRGESRRREVDYDAAPDHAFTSARRTDARADLVDANRAIAALPQELRDVFLLREVEGYSHDEVARLLGISTGASRVRLSRAFDRIGTSLTAHR